MKYHAEVQAAEIALDFIRKAEVRYLARHWVNEPDLRKRCVNLVGWLGAVIVYSERVIQRYERILDSFEHEEGGEGSLTEFLMAFRGSEKQYRAWIEEAAQLERLGEA